MSIPQEFIDELLDQIDIVDLIGQRVPLKSRGNRHVACCPFHNEKTPSFTVDAHKQFYYCFGCRASGTAINFLMRKDGLDFVSAIHQLAAQQGMKVPDSYDGDGASRQRVRHLADILDASAQFYRQSLKENHSASLYAQNRKIHPEVMSEMRVGYAPGGWDTLISHFANRYSVDDLLSVGLIKPSAKKPDQHYDVFRDRLMFPIRNSRGQTVGFGGRALNSEDPAKYLNTSATALFHKKSEIYGLYEVSQHRSGGGADDDLFLVEGYMDVIALKCHGIHNAVACMGTAVNRIQIQRLLKKSKRLILCFDGDEAGRQAAWRSVEEGLHTIDDNDGLHLLFLPDGEDPDTYLQKYGADGWRDYVTDHIQELDEFIFEHLSKNRDLALLSNRISYAREVVRLCRTLRSQLPRQLLQDALTERAGIAKTTMESLMRDSKSTPDRNRASLHKPRRVRISRTVWDDFLVLLVAYPSLLKGLEADELLIYLDRQKDQGRDGCPDGCLTMLIECFRKHAPNTARQILSALASMLQEYQKDQNEQTAKNILRLERLQEIAMSPDISFNPSTQAGTGEDEIEANTGSHAPSDEIKEKFARVRERLHKTAMSQKARATVTGLVRGANLDELDNDAISALRATYKTSKRTRTADKPDGDAKVEAFTKTASSSAAESRDSVQENQPVDGGGDVLKPEENPPAGHGSTDN